jgi:hypothetical protein
MTKVRVALATFGLFLALSPRQVDAYCTEGTLRNYTGATMYDAPVYLVAPNSTIFGFDKNIVAHHLQVGVDDWTEEGAAEFRPYFAGIVTSVPSQIIDGSTYVIETTNCNTCSPTNACETTQYYNGYRTGSKVYLESGCSNTWSLTQGGGGQLLLNVFKHEIGHSWGLEDEYANPNGTPKCEGVLWDSIMAGTCTGKVITRRDVGAMRSLYGQRNKTYAYRESTNGGVSWVAGNPSGGNHTAYMRIGSLGTRYNLNSEVYAQALLNENSPYYTLMWLGVPGSTHVSTAPYANSLSRSWDVAGAAAKSGSVYAIAYRTNETETVCDKRITVSVTESNGASWNTFPLNNASLGVLTTKADGVSMAYDPATDKYVLFWGADNLASETVSATSPYTRGPYKSHTGNGSWEYASVTCNETAYAGSQNCLVAWTERAWAYFNIRYARAYVNASGELVMGAAQSAGYHGWQSPSVTANPSSSYPFVMAFKQGNTIFTARYEAATGTFVSSATAVSLGGGLLMGAMGVFNGPELNLRHVPL